MERPSQLMLRNRAALEAGELLLINPPADHLFQELALNGRKISVWCHDYGDYRWFLAQGVKAEFGVVPGEEPLPPQVIMFLPREKERLDLMLHFMATTLPITGSLWLAGENQSGIRSAARLLKKYFGQVVKTDTARHSAPVSREPGGTDALLSAGGLSTKVDTWSPGRGAASGFAARRLRPWPAGPGNRTVTRDARRIEAWRSTARRRAGFCLWSRTDWHVAVAARSSAAAHVTGPFRPRAGIGPSFIAGQRDAGQIVAVGRIAGSKYKIRLDHQQSPLPPWGGDEFRRQSPIF